MHFDPWPSILVQLQGEKHVVVGPPDDDGTAQGAPAFGHAHTRGGGLLQASPQKKTRGGAAAVDEAVLAAVPDHPPLPPRALACSLRPGELLFLPPG